MASAAKDGSATTVSEVERPVVLLTGEATVGAIEEGGGLLRARDVRQDEAQAALAHVASPQGGHHHLAGGDGRLELAEGLGLDRVRVEAAVLSLGEPNLGDGLRREGGGH